MFVKRTGLMAVCGLLFLAGQARADTTVFMDNFDAESQALATTSLNNWTATSGNVDVIGPGLFDWYPGNGNYVDMDGNRALGTLTHSGLFLDSGDYTLSFDLAGPGNPNKANGDSVRVLFAGLDETFQLNVGQAFQTITLNFSVAQAGAFDLQFIAGAADGADGGGMLLDDVAVVALDGAPNVIPTPLAASAGIALLGLLAARRRR